MKNVLKIKKSVFRLILSAFFGGLYAVMMLFVPHVVLIGEFVTYIGAIEIMVWIAFGKSGIKENIKKVLFIYLITFLLNGIINIFHVNDNMWKVLFIVLISCGIMIVGIKKVMEMIGEESVRYIVKITEENKSISVKALKDTGNHLTDPLTNKPVSIIEKDILYSLIEDTEKKFYVPFQSVGKSNGLMEAYIVEQIELGGKQYHNTEIGVFEGKLSKNHEYQMILHPKLFESGGK